MFKSVVIKPVYRCAESDFPVDLDQSQCFTIFYGDQFNLDMIVLFVVERNAAKNWVDSIRILIDAIQNENYVERYMHYMHREFRLSRSGFFIDLYPVFQLQLASAHVLVYLYTLIILKISNLGGRNFTDSQGSATINQYNSYFKARGAPRHGIQNSRDAHAEAQTFDKFVELFFVSI